MRWECVCVFVCVRQTDRQRHRECVCSMWRTANTKALKLENDSQVQGKRGASEQGPVSMGGIAKVNLPYVYSRAQGKTVGW